MEHTLKQFEQLRFLAWTNKWSSSLTSNDRFTPPILEPQKVFSLKFTKTVTIESLNTPTYSIQNGPSHRGSTKRKYLKVTFTNLNSLPYIMDLIADPLRELILDPEAVDNVNYTPELKQYEKQNPTGYTYPGYYAPLEKMVNSGWHFSDNLSPRGSTTPIRYSALTKNVWHGKPISYLPVVLPVLADLTADWLKVWEKFTQDCLDAYNKYPDQVVYRNIHGQIVPDVTKTELLF